MIESLKIVALSVLVCVAYGILHDQVTARVCVEYFTIGHPRLLPPAYETPTLLALAWGVIATWWVGVLLGVPLALACQVGGLPKREAKSLVQPLLLIAAVSALAAGLTGTATWAFCEANQVVPPPPFDQLVPADKHAAFIADFVAHNTSYLGGFVGGVTLMITTLRWRWRAWKDARTAAVSFE